MKFYKNSIFRLFLVLILLVSFACEDNGNNPADPDPPEESVREIVVFYTNDEHGWLEETATHSGAAGMAGLWKENHGYGEDDNFIVLSGGDMWTGPAISTYTQGRAMVDVMNAMNYSAGAIGNHEFDFKVEGLRERRDQADFPFLSANIREKSTGAIPDFATPYIVKEVNEVKIGIVGLTTLTAPTSTFPDNVKDYDFINYETALTEYVPKAKEDGAELIFVIGHICVNEIRALTSTASDLGISLIGGGHCHETALEKSNGVIIIEAGGEMQYYVKAEISYDIDADEVLDIETSLHENVNGTPDAAVQSVVEYWQQEVDVALSEVIGFADQEIDRNSDGMYNMITDSWLYTYPNAQISCTNAGGIRQSIPAGNITLATMIGVLPFENDIIELELSGAHIAEVTSRLIVGGMTRIGGFKLADGTPIESGEIYSVLTIDYLYSRSDYNFSVYDHTPDFKYTNYRQPVIDWIKSMNTSATNPLNQYLDNNPR